MKPPRFLTVFFCAAIGILAVAVIKALIVSGLDVLPALKLLLFTSSMFGFVAAMLDWALFRPRAKGAPADVSSEGPVSQGRSHVATAAAPPLTRGGSKASVESIDGSRTQAGTKALDIPARNKGAEEALLERARLRPIVFREIVPPPASPGLSFYGGTPIAPANFTWPRMRNKPGNAPLSFVMQWDCAELAGQDATGLLPRDGVLYLFCDLTWGDPFDFQFIHAPALPDSMQTIPIPPDLPRVYGDEGAHIVPYCSPEIAKEHQDVPRLLPKWPFTPVAFSYPAPPGAPGDQGAWFWSETEAVSEALLLAQHPEGVPAAKRRDEQPWPFARPFDAFPQDYATVRVVAAKVLHDLRWPSSWLLRGVPEPEREAKFKAWRDQATQLYLSAVPHRPAERVEQAAADEIWRWMQDVAPVLTPGWRSLVAQCVNVSLGLGSEAASAIPADMVAACAEWHQLAHAYLHDEHPDRRQPDAIAKWEARKAEGSLKEVRSIHAPSPVHMFGPPSYVQGYVEEYLDEWMLLLELSSRGQVGMGEGVLQFLIRPADLRERQFDRVELVASAY
jgi:hypothetical protein